MWLFADYFLLYYIDHVLLPLNSLDGIDVPVFHNLVHFDLCSEKWDWKLSFFISFFRFFATLWLNNYVGLRVKLNGSLPPRNLRPLEIEHPMPTTLADVQIWVKSYVFWSWKFITLSNWVSHAHNFGQCYVLISWKLTTVSTWTSNVHNFGEGKWEKEFSKSGTGERWGG